jgi:hypothetical protein
MRALVVDQTPHGYLCELRTEDVNLRELSAQQADRMAVVSWRWDVKEGRSECVEEILRGAKFYGLTHVFLDTISVPQNPVHIPTLLRFSEMYKTMKVLCVYPKKKLWETKRRVWVVNELAWMTTYFDLRRVLPYNDGMITASDACARFIDIFYDIIDESAVSHPLEYGTLKHCTCDFANVANRNFECPHTDDNDQTFVTVAKHIGDDIVTAYQKRGHKTAMTSDIILINMTDYGGSATDITDFFRIISVEELNWTLDGDVRGFSEIKGQTDAKEDLIIVLLHMLRHNMFERYKYYHGYRNRPCTHAGFLTKHRRWGKEKWWRANLIVGKFSFEVAVEQELNANGAFSMMFTHRDKLNMNCVHMDASELLRMFQEEEAIRFEDIYEIHPIKFERF